MSSVPDGWPGRPSSERSKDASTIVHSGDCCYRGSRGRSTGDRHRANPRRGTGDGRKPTGAVLAEQAERAGGCGERIESDRIGGGRQRGGRRRGMQCRDRQHLSVHARSRHFRRLLLLRQRTQLDPADLHRLERAQLPRRARENTDPPCQPGVGPIGTLPWYFENGLVSDGDPGVAFGPKHGPNGFSWANGSRLYYSNLTSNFPTTAPAFKGFEAIAVSRTDDVRAAANNTKGAWMPPVVISRQSNTTFSDKSQVWADNAESSPFFGTVYVCWAAFRGQEKGNAAPAPLQVAASRDGGNTWTQRQISAAANNGQRNPPDGCTIRTDSRGTAYVFGVGTVQSAGKQSFELLSQSANGGQTWSSQRPVAGPVTQPGTLDPVQGRPVIDGVAGARSDLAPAPSVDIANGAPTGSGATNRIVMSYVSGPLATPHVFFAESMNRGADWTEPRAIETPLDRGLFAAPAISPNGRDVYVVYNAFTTPFRPTTAEPRSLVGVVKHADAGASGPTGAFSDLHRAESTGP